MNEKIKQQSNLDRFGFKAKSNQRGNYWLYASLDFYDGIGSYGVRYHLEPGGDTAFSPAWIDPKTICQCTGIRDSDGQLIYEHDIIEAKDVKGIGFYEKSEVLWDGCEWSKKSRFICSIRGLFDLYENGEVTIKVIGNKFDKEDVK